MADRIRGIKGQGILESAMTFMVMALLLAGVLQIWLWGNKQIVERQMRYNASRVAAGTSSDGYNLQWPVYAPPALTEDMVLKGQ
jgi:hypothetical protein